MSNNNAVPVLNQCIFVQNVAATDFGGGMYNTSASPRIEECVFTGNQAFRGGGIYNLVSSPQVTNSRFAGNRADSSGGGLEDNLATTRLTNSIFMGNTAGFGGALLIGGSSTSSLINCTVAGNAATFEGGGLYNSNSTPIFGNSIFWDNTAPVGASIHTPDATRPVITYSCVQGGYTGAGNLDADPLFAGVPPYGSLQLQAGSPCLDTGTSVGAPTEDFLGRTRPQGTAVDMGAYEGALESSDIVSLTLAVRPEDGGMTVPPTGTYSFGVGEPVLLQAVETDLSFRYWDGDVTGWEAVQEITITEDLDITAVFGTNVIFVDEHSPAVYPDGSSWDRAYRNIQSAIDSAFALGESEVWVAAGSYTADTDPVVTLLEGIPVYGGFAGTELERDQRDWTVNVTVIDGEGVRRCISGADGAVLDGFTVTHGWAGSGGGMVNWPASPTVANCVFTANTAAEKGGGMFSYDSSPQVIGCTFQANTAGFNGGGMFNAGTVSVEHCIFSGNTAGTGGGIENAFGGVNITNSILEANTASFSGGGIYNADAAEPVVTRCSFVQNVSGDFGGGIYNLAPSCSMEACEFDGNSAFGGAGVSTVDASPMVSNCIFKNNQAEAGGGGIHIYGGSPEVTNCVFWGNTANMGGALAIVDAAEPRVMNCTLAGNTAAEYAAALLVTNASPFITNSILWGNVAPIYQETLILPPAVATVTFSCIAGGYAGTGNMNADPRFVDPTAGELQLQAHSPCIDSGTDAGAPCCDITDTLRPQNTTYDMGAYEFAGSPVPGLSIMPQKTYVGPEAGTLTFEIVTPGPWTASASVAWATPPDSGTGNASVSVTYETNTGPARIAMITVTGTATTPLTEILEVNQESAAVNEGEGEVPAEGEGEPPAEGEVAVEGEGEALVEGEGEVSDEGEGEMPVEGEGETPTEGEGEVPAEGEGETPVEGEGELPAEGEGETPAEGEGEASVEGEGELPAEGEGETPVEGEGEGETANEGEGEAIPEGEGEVAPEGEGEVAPEGEGEVAPEGEGEVAPEGEGEVASEGEGELTSEGEGEEVPEGEGETLIEGEGEGAAEGEGEESGCCGNGSKCNSISIGIKRYLGDFLLLGVCMAALFLYRTCID